MGRYDLCATLQYLARSPQAKHSGHDRCSRPPNGSPGRPAARATLFLASDYDLRWYCLKGYLEYDEFIGACEPYADPASLFSALGAPAEPDRSAGPVFVRDRLRRNATSGHHDADQRLRDMDRDGVAAEVIHHGSQNGQCFPFVNPTGGTFNALFFNPCGDARELELAAVGHHMYNQWLVQ